MERLQSLARALERGNSMEVRVNSEPWCERETGMVHSGDVSEVWAFDHGF